MVFSMVLGTITLMSPKAQAQNIAITPNGGVSSMNNVTSSKNYYLNKTVTPNNDGTWDVEIALNNWNKQITTTETTYAPVDVVFIIDDSFSMDSTDHARMMGAVSAIEVSLLKMYKEIWRPQEIKAETEDQGTRLPRMTAVSLGGVSASILNGGEWMYIGQTSATSSTAKNISQAIMSGNETSWKTLAEGGSTHTAMANHATGIWGTYPNQAFKKAQTLLDAADAHRQKVVVIFSDGEPALPGDATNILAIGDAKNAVEEAYKIKNSANYKNVDTGKNAIIYSILITSTNKTWNNVFQDYTTVGKSQVAPW